MHAFSSTSDFFQNKHLEKFFQEYHLNVKQFWTLIRPDDLLSLIWVQTVCKDNQQMILAGKMLKESEDRMANCVDSDLKGQTGLGLHCLEGPSCLEI